MCSPEQCDWFELVKSTAADKFGLGHAAEGSVHAKLDFERIQRLCGCARLIFPLHFQAEIATGASRMASAMANHGTLVGRRSSKSKILRSYILQYALNLVQYIHLYRRSGTVYVITCCTNSGL